MRGLTRQLELSTPDLTQRVAAELDARLDAHIAAPVALALSGGGDSVALLAVASGWARARGRRLLAFTVDHGLNPDSARWSLMAAETARRLGVEWRGLRWTASKPAAGLPAAARTARHGLIADAAREAGACVVLFAHTRDDIEEAELMRGQGSSLGRLRVWGPSPAWPQGRGVFLLRPMLEVSRAALRDFLRDAGLDWIEDPANDDLRYARARARRALPLSEAPLSQFLPQGPAGKPGPYGAVTVDEAGVISIPRPILNDDAGLLLSAALVCAAGGDRPPRGKQLSRLQGRVASDVDFTATLSGARIEVQGGRVRIMRDAGELGRLRPASKRLAPVRVEPGRAVVWDGRFEIELPGAGEVRALAGLAARLSPPERAELARFPAAARPTLPVFLGDGTLSPLLAFSSLRVRSLAGARLAAACGVIAHEREIAVLSRGEGPMTSLC